MQNQEEVSLADLVASESFQRYCLAPTPADIDHWKQWLEQHPGHQSLVDEAKKWVIGMSSQLTDQEIERAKAKLLMHIASQETKAQEPMTRRSLFRPWMAVAAAITLLCAFFLFEPFSQPEMLQVQTRYGESLEHTLPDGSRVQLNANTRISFAENWENSSKREVWIGGEAYFDVVSNPSQAFVVHTSKGDVQVLGTQFNVRDRAEKLDLTLVEGKVAFTSKDQEKFTLNPGGHIHIAQGQILQDSIDTDASIAWCKGHFLVNDVTVQEIIDRLKAEFNWEIQVENPQILEKQIHAVIQEYNPEMLIEAISAIYDLQVQRLDSGQYIIR